MMGADPSRAYDVAVVGLGAFGSATICALAGRGVSPVGFDRYRPPHALGSSHGDSRMIREAYFEAPFYVPLVQLAYERWAALERRAGRRLLEQTGGLMLGSPEGELVRGCLESAETHGLPHETLSADDVAGRFPFVPGPDTVAIWEPRAGILKPEACIRTCLELAAAAGAELQLEEPVESWRMGQRVVLQTSRGEYRARKLLIAAGAWTARLVPELELPLEVERTVQFWLRPRDAAPGDPESRLARCPVWAWEYAADKIWYGFPDRGDGVKAGFHHSGEIVDPDESGREVAAAEKAAMRETVSLYMPEAAGEVLRSAVCTYTNTPDGHFLIGRHPAAPEVWIAGGGSGHGFKFASALGEVLADALTERRPSFDLRPFRVDRF